MTGSEPGSRLLAVAVATVFGWVGLLLLISRNPWWAVGALPLVVVHVVMARTIRWGRLVASTRPRVRSATRWLLMWPLGVGFAGGVLWPEAGEAPAGPVVLALSVVAATVSVLAMRVVDPSLGPLAVPVTRPDVSYPAPAMSSWVRRRRVTRAIRLGETLPGDERAARWTVHRLLDREADGWAAVFAAVVLVVLAGTTADRVPVASGLAAVAVVLGVVAWRTLTLAAAARRCAVELGELDVNGRLAVGNPSNDVRSP